MLAITSQLIFWRSMKKTKSTLHKAEVYDLTIYLASRNKKHLLNSTIYHFPNQGIKLKPFSKTNLIPLTTHLGVINIIKDAEGGTSMPQGKIDFLAYIFPNLVCNLSINRHHQWDVVWPFVGDSPQS